MNTHAEVNAVTTTVGESTEAPSLKAAGVAPKRRVRSIRIPLRWLITGGAVVGVVAGLSISLASNHLTVLIRQARDGYVVYRLAAERDELRATKLRLERELTEVKSNHSQASAFEATVKGRLAELNAVVESSTALGVFKRDKRGKGARGTVLANLSPKASGKGDGSAGSRPNDAKELTPSALAALLDSPVLRNSEARGSGRRNGEARHRHVDPKLEELRAINKGLGGAEVECRRAPSGKIVCASSVAKEDVAYTDVRAALKPDFAISENVTPGGQMPNPGHDGPLLVTAEQQHLLDTIDYYTETLRSLPIGSPVPGEITSGYGYRVSPFSHRSSFHEGIDISLEKGTRIRAPGDGIVVKAEYDGAYGWVVDIAHAGKIITRYAHLNKAMVRTGQRVRRGQIIALSGSTGRSTGPHLHYEVRVNGLAKNPMPYISLAEKLNKTLERTVG